LRIWGCNILILKMEIYKGFYYFRKHNGKIKKCSYFKNHINGSLVRVVGGGEGLSFHIMVNKKDSLKEQIKTVLHEFSHLGIEYEYIIKAHKLASMEVISTLAPLKLEKRIEENVEIFYLRNPPLIRWIEKKLTTYNQQL